MKYPQLQRFSKKAADTAQNTWTERRRPLTSTTDKDGEGRRFHFNYTTDPYLDSRLVDYASYTSPDEGPALRQALKTRNPAIIGNAADHSRNKIIRDLPNTAGILNLFGYQASLDNVYHTMPVFPATRNDYTYDDLKEQQREALKEIFQIGTGTPLSRDFDSFIDRSSRLNRDNWLKGTQRKPGEIKVSPRLRDTIVPSIPEDGLTKDRRDRVIEAISRLIASRKNTNANYANV